jgi:hypothetical protein
MIVRLFGALCGAWTLHEAFASDLLDDASETLDRVFGALLDRDLSVPR